jgi:hypothetical protein
LLSQRSSKGDGAEGSMHCEFISRSQLTNWQSTDGTVLVFWCTKQKKLHLVGWMRTIIKCQMFFGLHTLKCSITYTFVQRSIRLQTKAKPRWTIKVFTLFVREVERKKRETVRTTCYSGEGGCAAFQFNVMPMIVAAAARERERG